MLLVLPDGTGRRDVRYFIDELSCAASDMLLGTTSGTHGEQTAGPLVGVEQALLDTLAAALAAFAALQRTPRGDVSSCTAVSTNAALALSRRNSRKPSDERNPTKTADREEAC